MNPVTEVYHIDCVQYMQTLPDKYFDLAIVDPPYGGGSHADAGGQFERLQTNKELGVHFNGRGRSARYQKFIKVHRESCGGGNHKKYHTGNNLREWDNAPPQAYFDELFRVSKNQIIWGGNYFGLPPTRCFLVWRKLTISENFSMAMCEYAWTSFNDNAKYIEIVPQGNKKYERFHPTQKPVKLYHWILQNYAKQGDKIFDSHLGSGSSRIAAYRLGYDFYAAEIDKQYFEAQEARFRSECLGEKVLNNNVIMKQLDLEI